MHTDEYEISVGREITLCRKMVKQLAGSIQKFEKRFGMPTESALKLLEKGEAESPEQFQQWREQYLEFQHWDKLLREYEEVYRNLKKIL